MYRIIPRHIPKDERAETNEKILFDIESGQHALSPEDIYNRYTGLGGLHQLDRDDFDNYNDYARAKREFELGQFFTPHELCRTLTAMLAPTPDELVMDMCCGMGNFYNHMPNQHNCHGFDVDGKAVAVARHLYPDAKITKCDIVQYRSDVRFDAIIGNPPYNLNIDRQLSQYYYMHKARELLNPAGILMMIAPQSFLAKEFWEKSKVSVLNRDFSFIGQSALDPNSFASLGVTNFQTKVMVFSRKSTNIALTPYTEELIPLDELGERLAEFRRLKTELRIKLLQEANHLSREELEEFEYKTAKYLYEIKTHPHLRKHYKKSLALVTKFHNQKPPDNCTNEEFKEWEKKKLTTTQVLKTLRRRIRDQYVVTRKEVALVRTKYEYKIKQYAPRMVKDIDKYSVQIYDLVLGKQEIHIVSDRNPTLEHQLKAARKVIDRKRRQYDRQMLPFPEMEKDTSIAEYLEKATFINKDYEVCQFTELQKSDLNLVLQKRYSLLNWQQGSGKTAAVYHYAKYLMATGKVRNTVVLAPAIATNLTWESFLKVNGENFRCLRRIGDFKNIRDGEFLVVSNSMLDKLKRHLSKFMKTRSRKVCLIFDESDEITNPLSERTLATLASFRRARYKVLATGTTTRNNINELYSQLELLYNNSVYMICECPTIYRESEGLITPKDNDYYGRPFPAHVGHRLFKACFCPGKTSVFGIEKQNQDIYNKDHLFDIISRTIITRKFREFAGEKYEIHTQSVKPHDGEFEVYRVIMEEFCRICEKYFNSTGDSRKEAGLRMMRQIKLLIKACSVPHLIDGYFGDRYPGKVRHIARMIKDMPGKVAVGCTSLAALDMYREQLSQEFPDRPLFVIRGDVSFTRRQKIIRQFESTVNGILVCTQQSLKSSANIPTCNEVILESLQWNIPKMEQFYFRFIRLDSRDKTNVHFVSYVDSIEQNLMALVLTKERLNEFIKSGEVMEQSEIFEEFDISMSVIESLLIREQDSEGKVHISWGSQRIAA